MTLELDSNEIQLTLRPEQEQAIEEVWEAFNEGYHKVIACMPTGGGKTETAIGIIKRANAAGTRVAFIVDRNNLVRQTSERLYKYGVQHGIMQGLNSRDDHLRTMVVSVQTAEARGIDFAQFGLLIVDECHVQRKYLNTYIQEELPAPYVIGLTATPYGPGLGLVYEKVISTATTFDLVEKGYLANVKAMACKPIDTTGLKLNSMGEWNDGDVAERVIKVRGDITSEWAKQVHRIYGGPKKTLVFSATVDDGAALKESWERLGYNFEQVSYKHSDGHNKKMIAEFSRPDTRLHGLINSEMCLSMDTEILTDDGWATFETLNHFAKIANYHHKGGKITFSKPEKVIKRPLNKGERWVEYDNPKNSWRVTEDHRMLVGTRYTKGYDTVKAGDLVGRKSFMMPVSGEAVTPAVINHGPGKSPYELTIAECKLIGMFLGDGWWGKTTKSGMTPIYITQSVGYPEIVTWIDQVARDTGYQFNTTLRKISEGSRFPSVIWSFMTPPSDREGIGRISHYFEKDGSELLNGLNEEQFAALMEGLNHADGRHDKTRKAYEIVNTNKSLLDRLQAIGVVHGWKISLKNRVKVENRKQAFTMYARPGKDKVRVAAGKHQVEFVDANKGDECWCVRVPSGYIVTRRKGFVTIMGNCIRGSDIPSAHVLVDARPFNKSFRSVAQMLGRIIRAFPGKEFGLILSFSDNLLRFYDELMRFWSEGPPTELNSDERKEVTKNDESEARRELSCVCGHIFMPQEQICPDCGKERPKRQVKEVEHLPGRLEEIDIGPANKAPYEKHEYLADPVKVWPQLCSGAMEMKSSKPEKQQRKEAEKLAWATFFAIYGGFPPGIPRLKFDHRHNECSQDVYNWMMHRRIRYAKGRGG